MLFLCQSIFFTTLNIPMANNQVFKAVYFSDYKETNPKAKGVVLAFGERNKDL